MHLAFYTRRLMSRTRQVRQQPLDRAVAGSAAQEQNKPGGATSQVMAAHV
jgi:hypothetical protein